MSLLGFGMGTMLANFYMCGIMLVLRAGFNMLVRNASPRGPMCFSRCLICFLLCVACLGIIWRKQFAICSGVVVILLMNVMEVFSVWGGVCSVG